MTWQKEFCTYLRERIEENGYSCKPEFCTETGGRVDLLVLYPIPEPFHYSQVAAIEIEESYKKWVQVTTNLSKILTSRHVNPQVVVQIFREHLPADKETTLVMISGKHPLIVVNGISDFKLCAERVFLELDRLFKYNEEISSLLRTKNGKRVFGVKVEVALAILANPIKKRIIAQCFRRGDKTFRQLVRETGLKEIDVGAAISDLCSLGVLEKKELSTKEGVVATFSLPMRIAPSLERFFEEDQIQ